MIGCGARQLAGRQAETALHGNAGRILPGLVGTWKSKEEVYTFAADGSYVEHYNEIVATGPTTKGKRVGGTSGRWSATNNALLLEVSTGAKHLLLYALQNDGATLDLRPTYVKASSSRTYQREK
jgi:hypothetical protein